MTNVPVATWHIAVGTPWFGWRATMSRVSAAMVRPVGRSGEHLNGSGGLTNRPPRAPDCFRRMRKVVQPPEPLGCDNE